MTEREAVVSFLRAEAARWGEGILDDYADAIHEGCHLAAASAPKIDEDAARLYALKGRGQAPALPDGAEWVHSHIAGRRDVDVGGHTVSLESVNNLISWMWRPRCGRNWRATATLAEAIDTIGGSP